MASGIRGLVAGAARSWSMRRDGVFVADRSNEPALDRDLDGVLNGDE